jgi:hypothetical protein
MGEMRNSYKIMVGKINYHLEDLGIDRKMISGWILEK